MIPCFNEAESLESLKHELELALKDFNDCECIWIDDGSSDETWNRIISFGEEKSKVHHVGLRLRVNYGQTTALAAGIENARNDWIVTIDGDGQNDPRDIPRMIELVRSDNDVICGYRYDRKDTLFKRRLPSRMANSLARLLFTLDVRDLGCTLRLFNRKLLGGMRLIGEMHRTLTIYLKLNGGSLKEIPVNHRSRRFGESKYGWERIFKFTCDLILARTYRNLKSSPIYLFLGFGLFQLAISFIAIVVIEQFLQLSGSKAQITLFALLISLFFLIHFVLMGLLGELLLRNNIELNRNSHYVIREIS